MVICPAVANGMVPLEDVNTLASWAEAAGMVPRREKWVEEYVVAGEDAAWERVY